MTRPIHFLLLGVVLGGAVAAVVVLAIGPGGGGHARTDDLEQQVAELRRERDRLEGDLAEARSRHDSGRTVATDLSGTLEDLAEERPPLVEPEVEPIEDPAIRDVPAPTGLTDQELETELRGLRSSFQGMLLGTSDRFHEKVQEILARGGPGTVDRILAEYRDAQDLGAKAILAHALAQTDDPTAIAELQRIARSPDAGLFDRRTATHGLAFSDREGMEDFYREVARDPQIETGARANSAFGLARRTDEGVEVYGRIVDEAFEKKDAFALAYLSGFQILGKRSVPAVEKRLLTLREPQARLVMVAHLAEHGTPASAAALRALAAEPDVSEELRKQALAAAEKLEKAAGEGD